MCKFPSKQFPTEDKTVLDGPTLFLSERGPGLRAFHSHSFSFAPNDFANRLH